MMLWLWPFNGSPKEILVFIPGLAIPALAGSALLLRTKNAGWSAVLMLLLAIPWVLGIQVSYANINWGPGFELHEYDGPIGDETASFALVPATGSAFPTWEGPRPLGGHWHALLGGDWRSYLVRQVEERHQAIALAEESGYPLLFIPQNFEFFVLDLTRKGYTSSSPSRAKSGEQSVQRLFHRPDSSSVVVVQPLSGVSFTDPQLEAELAHAAPEGKVIAHGTFPKGLWVVYRKAPTAMKKHGRNTAIVDLGAWADHGMGAHEDGGARGAEATIPEVR
jgi:hypothetical protein